MYIQYIGHETGSMSSHDSPPNEKVDVAQDEFVGDEKTGGSPEYPRHRGHPNRTEEEIERVDAIALAQGTTVESFRGLDEKKILRKVRVPGLRPSTYVLPAHGVTDGPPPHPCAGAALFTVLPRPSVQPTPSAPAPESAPYIVLTPKQEATSATPRSRGFKKTSACATTSTTGA